MKRNILLITVLFLLQSLNISWAQNLTRLSERWQGAGGDLSPYTVTKSVVDSQGSTYVASSTLNVSGNYDILLQKFDRAGVLIWETSYNGAADLDDFSTSLFLDNNGDIYVTGGSIENASNSFDLIVIKFDNLGQQDWVYTFNNGGNPDPYDVGTSISGDNSGSVFISGASFGSNSLSDYLTISLSSVNGNLNWSKRYDHTLLNDVPSLLRVRGSDILVSGGSQVGTSPVNWEVASLT